MIYFTSDNHFYHENIIKLSKRPFKNCDDMHSNLIKNWNDTVSNDDEVYIIGDFAYRGDALKVNHILEILNGKKYLVIGNHDKYLYHDEFNTNLYEWIKDYYILNYNKIKFVMFHYPILEWADYYKNSIHIYGHVHNSNSERLNILGKKAYNVGVDVNNYRPVSIEDIIKKCLKKI